MPRGTLRRWLSAVLPAQNRARATIIAVGIGFILFMHTGQQILFGQSPGGELVSPILKTLILLSAASLLARYLERREVSVVKEMPSTTGRWLAMGTDT